MGGEHALGVQPGQGDVLRVQRQHIGLLADRKPGDRPPGGLRAALHRLQRGGGGHLGMRAAGQHVALAQVQALAVFEQHQFLGRVHAGVAVRAQAPAAAVLQPQRHVEEAVAQVGFGRRAQAGHGARRSGRGVFLGHHVGGVHQAPACVHRGVRQQPLHRALAAPGEAIRHLLRLLGDVDVDGRARVERGEAGDGLAQTLRRNGAQRMRGQAKNSLLRLCGGREALQ